MFGGPAPGASESTQVEQAEQNIDTSVDIGVLDSIAKIKGIDTINERHPYPINLAITVCDVTDIIANGHNIRKISAKAFDKSLAKNI